MQTPDHIPAVIRRRADDSDARPMRYIGTLKKMRVDRTAA